MNIILIDQICISLNAVLSQLYFLIVVVTFVIIKWGKLLKKSCSHACQLPKGSLNTFTKGGQRCIPHLGTASVLTETLRAAYFKAAI